MEFLYEIYSNIAIPDLIDIIFISFFIYAILVLFKRTKAKFVFTGVLIITLVYFAARQFNLVLTTSILQSFFTIIFIALIVIFQEEIRHFFEQLAFWSLNSNSSTKESSEFIQSDIEILSETLEHLAEKKIGVLIVLPGKNPVLRYLEGGTDLNGKLSEPLLKSLFDPSSIGHDGAVLIENGTVVKFSCHLPLSKNFEQLKHLGTRHSAALGLSEVTDALCLVVSEERGVISVARNGEIHEIKPKHLNGVIKDFFNEINPPSKQRKWHEFITKNLKEKSVAILLASGMWFVIVHESALEYQSFEVPVKYTELPSDFKVESLSPEKTKITLLGTRKKFYFFNENDIEVFLKIPEASEGVRNIKLSDSNIKVPESFTLEEVEPEFVKINIKKAQKKINKKEVSDKE